MPIDRFLRPLSRLLLGVPIFIFGIQHYIYADFVVTLMQEWLPGRQFWTYVTGTALIAAGIALTLNQMARLAAWLLGVMIFIFVLLVHIPAVLTRPNEPDQITYLTQAFTFSGIAFLATAVVRQNTWGPSAWLVDRILAIGRWQVAIGFLVLGVRQFFQMPFVHRLVPDWPPGQVSWSMLSAICLVATGAGAMIKRERVPALAFAALLLLFLLIDHLPDVAMHPRTGDWGAFCKDAIVCAGALLLAVNARRGRST